MGTVFGACFPNLVILIILWGLMIQKDLDPENRPGPIHTPCSLLKESWMPVRPLLGLQSSWWLQSIKVGL